MPVINPDPEKNNPQLERALAREGVSKKQQNKEPPPSYQVIGADKIPVSDQLGKLWSSRLEERKKARTDPVAAWDEAIRYYENDQMKHRVAADDRSGANTGRRIGRSWAETENVVFANTTTMLPMLYAKNPAVEVTAVNTSDNQDWGETAETFINKILSMKTTPGVNLKPKARRGVLWCQLTNAAYLKVGWNDKADSSEQALIDLQTLSQQYAEAKDQKTIKEIEGKLAALEDRISVLTPAGLYSKLVSPFRLYTDDGCCEPDLSDATWIIEEDFLPTALINAVYGEKQGDEWKSVYEPSHVLNKNSDASSIDDEVNNFKLFTHSDSDERTAQSYGYQNDLAWKRAQYTKVLWIWDKTTRRVYLYAANNIKWPIWVWNDPLKLLGFFPYSALHFHEGVEGHHSKGEVTYYLDQQDSINDNNAALAQARDWAKRHVVYNKNKTNEQEVQGMLNGPNGGALGLNLDDGEKLDDVIKTLVPPAMQHPELLDNTRAYKFISMITGVSEAQQGAQFKTNTTNKAVNFYEQNIEIRADEKIDAIEDWIGDHAWKLLQIAATKYDIETISELIGQEAAKGWRQVASPEELRGKLELTVVGGSTDKPTSKNKKKAALEMAQALGQFAQIPAVVVVILKIFERAFRDDVVITADDWALINQAIQAQMQNQGGEGGAGGNDPAAAIQNASPEQIKEVVKNLPPEAQQKLAELTQQGMPPADALKQVLQMLQQA